MVRLWTWLRKRSRQDAERTSFFNDEWLLEALQAMSEAGIDLEDEDTVDALLSGTIREALPELSAGLVAQLVRHGDAMNCDHEALRGWFERELRATWSRPLGLLEMVIVAATELGSEINRELRANPSGDRKHVAEALTRLHGRACQTAREVFALLMAGYARGAHARWRTLHELAVVALFLTKHGDEIAERYLLHEVVESCRAANQYQRYHKELGLDPVAEGELTALRAERDVLVQRFGKPFKADWGWAASALTGSRSSFADLEEDVDMGHWRPYFKMSSHGVHAGPKGLFFDISRFPSGPDLIPVGASSMGLADPGHGTTISLLQITSAVVVEFPKLEGIVALRALQELSDAAGESFLEVQRDLERRAAARTHQTPSVRRRVGYWARFAVCRISRWRRSRSMPSR